MWNEHRGTPVSWLSYTILLCKTSYSYFVSKTEIIKSEELDSENVMFSFHNWTFSLMNVKKNNEWFLNTFIIFREKTMNTFSPWLMKTSKTMNTFWWKTMNDFEEINEHFLKKSMNTFWRKSMKMFDEKQWTILWL